MPGKHRLDRWVTIRQRFDVEPRPVRIVHADRMDVVLHRAISQGVRTSGVVRQHATELAHIATRGVGAEHQPVWFQLLIELGEIEARLDADPALFRVQLENAIHPATLQNDTAADGRAGQVRARGPGRDRNARGNCVSDGLRDIILGLRLHHRLGDHLVDTGIHGVGRERGEVVFDFCPPEFSAKIIADRTRFLREDQSRRVVHDGLDCTR